MGHLLLKASHIDRGIYHTNLLDKWSLIETGIEIGIRRTQLIFAIGIECGIHDRQVLKYQPSVMSRVIFHHLIS